jgi:predicted nicotinamide N-methyase
VTLPTASANSGRTLHFQNYQAQTLVSASSNVVPLAGGAATTAILAAVAGANATLVSDGTNWIMTQYTSNNALLLE